MALSKSSLATRIENAISSAFSTPVNPDMHKYALAMATAIVEEITSNAEVDSNIPVSSTGTGIGSVVNNEVRVNVSTTGATTAKGKII